VKSRNLLVHKTKKGWTKQVSPKKNDLNSLFLSFLRAEMNPEILDESETGFLLILLNKIERKWTVYVDKTIFLVPIIPLLVIKDVQHSGHSI
jgi:hypothetical protein